MVGSCPACLMIEETLKMFTHQIIRPTHITVNHKLGFNAAAPFPLPAASTPTSQPSLICLTVGSSAPSLGFMVSCAATTVYTTGPFHKIRIALLQNSRRD